jgi:hypothetical protein
VTDPNPDHARADKVIMTESLELSDVQPALHPAVFTRAAAVPWYLWCAALAVTSAYVGAYWDISWHRSIGRDTFWTLPHLVIYACGILAGISSGYLILTTTFAREATLRDASVRIWGLRGPLGAFISAWGGVAMLVSAPFDDWWHSAYGLDVKIVSPPHILLALGFFSIQLGTLILLLGFMNRAADETRKSLRWLLLYVAGVALAESLVLKIEYTDRSSMHDALFYCVVMLGTPLLLTMIATASGHRWACTIMAAVYSAFNLVFLWLFPLFPAEPKLGPVYQRVTHFIPWEFPLLIIVPAFAVDLLLQRTGSWRRLTRAVAAGTVFLTTFIAVQWPFAYLLMLPLARNWFFGAHYMDYGTPADTEYARFEFNPPASAGSLSRGLLIALFISCVMAWIGLAIGRWMQRVRR